MKDKLSNILIGFQKGHSVQHSLLTMIEKWKRALDENMKVGAIFINLSKDCFWLSLKHMIFLNNWKTILQVVFKGLKSVIVIVHGLK